MNEAIDTKSQTMAAARPATPSSKLSTSAKAQQLKRTAAERTQELRKAALREKLARLEELERQVQQKDQSSNSGFAQGTLLAGLQDADWDEIKSQLDNLHEEAERYIRENPTKAVLSAAGVGFVLGLLMRR